MPVRQSERLVVEQISRADFHLEDDHPTSPKDHRQQPQANTTTTYKDVPRTGHHTRCDCRRKLCGFVYTVH
jgi:hypothetical protein